MNSVFGKVLVSAMLVLGLTAASCNQRSGEVRVQDDTEENDDVRIRDRQNNDSVDINRDQAIDRDDDADKMINDNSNVDVDRNNSGQSGSEGTNERTRSTTQGNRGTNQGNDTKGDAGSERR